MALKIDARIPVRFGVPSSEQAAFLVEQGVTTQAAPAMRFALPQTGHVPGCECCAPLGPIAAALRALFIARAKGDLPFFREIVVLASPAGEAAVRETLAADALLIAWFRSEVAKA
jgi:hypothetical protein